VEGSTAHNSRFLKKNEGDPVTTRKELLSTPIHQIDLTKVKSVADLVDQMKGASIQARNLGKCASVYENMLMDSARPTVIMGLSGALIAGGLRFVLRDMVANGIVDCIVSTGAVLYQDFYQAMGYQHYKGDPGMDNLLLREHFIDRIYDTLVDEEKFREVDAYIGKITEQLEPRGYSTREFLRFMGEVAYKKGDRGILATCYQYGVPCFVPALNDSSIGIGLTEYYEKHRNKPHFYLDPIRDNYELTQIKGKSKKTGVIYIGGGTPKNYINDVEVIAEVLGYDVAGHEYAFQITTDRPDTGGLSGSTLEEAQSWGKIHREATKATVWSEATLALPLLVANIFQKGLHKGRRRVQFQWDGDNLKAIKLVAAQNGNTKSAAPESKKKGAVRAVTA
jgi:deoxyhypusine synthase